MSVARRIERWNIWRKRNRNSRIYKVMVLLGLIDSPTFNVMIAKFRMK